MNSTRLFQHAWRNGLVAYNMDRNTKLAITQLEFFRRQFLDLQEANLVDKSKERYFVNYEKKFNDEINTKYGADGILSLLSDEQNMFTYKRWLNGIIHGNHSIMPNDDEICRILLRVHRNDVNLWRKDIPQSPIRILVDQYECQSHTPYTK